MSNKLNNMGKGNGKNHNSILAFLPLNDIQQRFAQLKLAQMRLDLNFPNVHQAE